MKRLLFLVPMIIFGCGPECKKVTGPWQVRLTKLVSQSPGCESAKTSDTVTFDFGANGELNPVSIAGAGTDMTCIGGQDGCNLAAHCFSAKTLVSVTLDLTVIEPKEGLSFSGEMVTEVPGGGECPKLVHMVTSTGL